jgi:hypothetical protein
MEVNLDQERQWWLMSIKIRLLRVVVLSALLAAMCTAQTPSATAFQKLKSLAGGWEGKDEGGNPAKTNFAVVVAGTAVLETLSMSGMEDMLTVYSVDGAGIALVHYCPTNNQPRMQALPSAGKTTDLDFVFRDAGNMPVPTTGHQQKLVIHFEDDNHLTESWTWRDKGHDSVQTISFTRKSK